MASFLQNYATGIIQNAATGAATYAITTGGRVVGDVVISAGDLIEGGGRKVGDNIEGYIDRYGNWIRSHGDGMIAATAASSGGPALKPKALPASTGGAKRPALKKTASDSKALPSAGAKKALPGPRPVKALPAPPGAGAATKKAKDTVGGAAGVAKKAIPYIPPSPVSAPKPKTMPANKKTTAKPPGPPAVVSGQPWVKGPGSVAGGDDAKPNKRREKRFAERRANEAEDKGLALGGGSGANRSGLGAPAGGNANNKGLGGPQSMTMPSGKVRINPESRPRAMVSGKVGGGDKKDGKDGKDGKDSKNPAHFGKVVDGKYDFFAKRSDAGSVAGGSVVGGYKKGPGSVAGSVAGGKAKEDNGNTPKYGQFF